MSINLLLIPSKFVIPIKPPSMASTNSSHFKHFLFLHILIFYYTEQFVFSVSNNMASSQLLFLALLVATSSLVLASDPSPLQDFCVADASSTGNIYIYDETYMVF